MPDCGKSFPYLWAFLFRLWRLFFAPALAVAYMLATRDFVGRRALLALLQGALSFPTVAVGLILYMLLSRQGPLGRVEFAFYAGGHGHRTSAYRLSGVGYFALTALQKNDARVRETARTLGRRRSAGGLDRNL